MKGCTWWLLVEFESGKDMYTIGGVMTKDYLGAICCISDFVLAQSLAEAKILALK